MSEKPESQEMSSSSSSMHNDGDRNECNWDETASEIDDRIWKENTFDDSDDDPSWDMKNYTLNRNT